MLKFPVILRLVSSVQSRNYSVINVFGDWGMDTYDFRTGVDRLSTIDASQTILLGDNFYDNGVKSVDDPLWQLFRDIRNTSDTFYAIVGNHDYIHSAQAQVTYSKTDPVWNMPALYYYAKINTSESSNDYICGVFIDSYKFDETQLRWSRIILGSGECQSEDAFRIVFSHHPIHTVGIFQESEIVKGLNAQLKPVLEEFRVHAFIAGHEHDMQVFSDNGITYLISGAFSDKYSSNSETAEDPSLLWRNVGTAGLLQLYPDGENIQYDFVASNTGDSLYSGTINKSNEWLIAPASYEYKTPTISYTVSLLVCLVMFYVYF